LVEHQLPKLRVASSNLVTRSKAWPITVRLLSFTSGHKPLTKAARPANCQKLPGLAVLKIKIDYL
jgi:hypothetical protein